MESATHTRSLKHRSGEGGGGKRARLMMATRKNLERCSLFSPFYFALCIFCFKDQATHLLLQIFFSFHPSISIGDHLLFVFFACVWVELNGSGVIWLSVCPCCRTMNEEFANCKKTSLVFTTSLLRMMFTSALWSL